MAGPIATLRVMLSADDAELRKGLGRSDKASKKWAAAQKRRNKAVAQSFAKIGASVAVAGAAIGAMTVEAIKAADELAKSAKTIGITVEQLQAYSFAAERSGVSTAEMTKGLQQFNKFLGQAARGVGTAKTAFEDLGIAIHDQDGQLRGQEELINDFVDALDKIENPMMRAGLAADVFGRAGVKLLPMMKGGSANMRELMAAAKELGTVLDNETAAKAEVLNDKMDTLSETITTKLHTALIQAADANEASFVALIDSADAAVSVVFGAARVIQGTISAILGTVMKLAQAVTGVFTTIGRAIGVGVAAFIDGAKLLAVNAKLGAMNFVLAIMEGYNAARAKAPRALDNLLSYFGIGDPVDTASMKDSIAATEAHAKLIGNRMAAGMTAGINGFENNPLTEGLGGFGDALIDQAINSGKKAGENFKEAFDIAKNGGMGTQISGGIDDLGPAAGASDGTVDAISVEDRLAKEKELAENAKNQKKVEDDLAKARERNHKNTMGFLTQSVAGNKNAARVMSAVNTALAVSQIMQDTEVAATKALAVQPPAVGMALAASVRAQGMTSMAIAAANGVSGMFHDGIDNVPNTGTFLLEKGERVVDKRLNEDLTKALAAGNGSVGGNNNSVSITVNGMNDADAVNRIIEEQRPQFEQMFREINTDRAGQGLL